MKINSKSTEEITVHKYEIDLEDAKFEAKLRVEAIVYNGEIANFNFRNDFRFGRMTNKQENQVKQLIKTDLRL